MTDAVSQHAYQSVEDLKAGRVFVAGPIIVNADQIKAFARQFDPQPQHLDEEAAKKTKFEGLAASGWHTASITMRLHCDALVAHVPDNMGLGVENLRWLKPVRPGDALSIRVTIGAVRRSSSKPDFLIVPMDVQTLNQSDEVVMTMTNGMLVRDRRRE